MSIRTLHHGNAVTGERMPMQVRMRAVVQRGHKPLRHVRER